MELCIGLIALVVLLLVGLYFLVYLILRLTRILGRGSQVDPGVSLDSEQGGQPEDHTEG
jgi:hypothetical protein